MCGIAGFHIKNPDVVKQHSGIEALADKLLLGIETRGKHATGFVAVTHDGKVKLDKAAVPASEFIKDREKIPEGVQTLLLHTRYATKGPKEEQGNNHPVIYKTCFTIHNGMIYNDDDLFREFDLKRNYEVDTEIIPALLQKNGIDTLANAALSLSKFRGAMAIAAIDPTNSPKKLLLAKGDHSPLVVYESDNFLMWASLTSAMRDAWKEVLGTPPNYDKFEQMKEGQIILVDDTASERGEFVVPSFSRNSGAHDHWHRKGHQPWRHAAKPTPILTPKNGSRIGSNSSAPKHPFASDAEFKAAVKQRRKDGEGLSRIWSERENYADVLFSDVAKGESITWIPCGCDEAVCAPDMRRHIKYGYVCLDCYEVIRAKYAEKMKTGNNPAPEDHTSGTTGRGSEDEASVRSIPDKDKTNLENGAEIDAEANRVVIKAVEQATGYSSDAIDFLIHRTGVTAADFGVGVKTLKAELQKMYDEFTPYIWEDFGEQLLRGEKIDLDTWEGPGHVDPVVDSMQYVPFVVKKESGISESWFRCTQHGEAFRLGDECGPCQHQDDIARSGQGGSRVIQKNTCYECGMSFARYQLTYVESRHEYICDECKAFDGEACGVEPFDQVVLNELDEQIGAHLAPKAVDLTTIKRCETCKSFISANYPCRVCFVNGVDYCKAEDDRNEKCPGCHICGHKVAHEELVSTDIQTVDKCNGVHQRGVCGKKVKWCFGETWGYCDKHFKTCNKMKCGKKANHILATGERVCHGHSRSEPGARADNSLLREGYILMEVKR